jgi:hypothetical protein
VLGNDDPSDDTLGFPREIGIIELYEKYLDF